MPTRKKLKIMPFYVWTLFSAFLFFFKTKSITCCKSYKLNILQRISVDSIAIPPPITAEKKLLNACKQIFETNWPNKLEGKAIKKYFKHNFTMPNLKSGTAFLILLKFSKLMIVIEEKNDTIIEFIPIKGVKIIKQANKTNEPIM